MERCLIRPSTWLVAGALLVATPLTPVGLAQESRSAGLAKELVALLQGRKLDSIAARSPAADDQFVAALYFPGQLLVVSARHAAPPILNGKLARTEYRDVYIDLNAASISESKVLISHLGADGLKSKREANQPFDTEHAHCNDIRSDGNWSADKMSEQDYTKRFVQAEESYAPALQVLIRALK